MKSFLAVILPLLMLNIDIPALGQQPDYSLAKVGKKIQGVYIFIRTDPYYEYDYVGSVKVKINWTGSVEESFEKAIQKAKKKHPYFNGMIFQSSNFEQADLIRFKGLEVSRAGFTIGSKVSFIIKSVVYYGEIVELESSKDKASVQFSNLFNESEIQEIDYNDLTPLSEDDFTVKQAGFLAEIQRYQFEIGEEVTWIKTKILGRDPVEIKGVIVDLDEKNHKASIKFLNENNEDQIEKVSLLDLVKQQ